MVLSIAISAQLTHSHPLLDKIAMVICLLKKQFKEYGWVKHVIAMA